MGILLSVASKNSPLCPGHLPEADAGMQDQGVNPMQEETVTFRLATNVRVRSAAEASGGIAAIHAGQRAVQARQLHAKSVGMIHMKPFLCGNK